MTNETTPKEGASAPSTPETADQRRERLEKIIIGVTGKVLMAEDLVNAIVDSDRAAGCDPEVLRAQADEVISRLYADIAAIKAERDEARAKIERVKAEMEWWWSWCNRWWNFSRIIRNQRNEAQAEVKRLKADLKISNDAFDAQTHLWSEQQRIDGAERDDLAARLAVATQILQTVKDEALRVNGATVHLKRCVAVQANVALANLPARAAAMLRVVKVARRFLREDGSANRFGIEANKALDTLDGEPMGHAYEVTK